MKVYVLLRSDDYDRAEVVGVFMFGGAARQAAEQSEPDRTFYWQVMDGHDVAWDGPPGRGPVYSYHVEPHEVAP